ncbi:hypothetical protein PYCCODRAFT_1427277 [Trametes coccinea BRFM310]|uniref:Uncharacterized protein n=1 Tax=Trametes coccinea (strain BRFM310) TaxID=1353009 RepID=A0A1Y2IDN0_TRAC3|nr:hypothetical protein PYCCODRAFT_1427277 [Trametes coccinea BRFM310]
MPSGSKKRSRRLPPHFTVNQENGEVLATDLSAEDRRISRFSREQVRLILDLDNLLRSGRFDPRRDPIPAGYEVFGYLWDLDFLNAYGLAPLPGNVSGAGNHSTNGEQIPASLVMPREDDNGQFDPRFVQGLVAAAAQTFVRQQRIRDRAVKERQEKRARISAVATHRARTGRLVPPRDASAAQASPTISTATDAHSLFDLGDGIFASYPNLSTTSTAHPGLHNPEAPATPPSHGEHVSQAPIATTSSTADASAPRPLGVNSVTTQQVEFPAVEPTPQTTAASAPTPPTNLIELSSVGDTTRAPSAQADATTDTGVTATGPPAGEPVPDGGTSKDQDITMDDSEDILRFD